MTSFSSQVKHIGKWLQVINNEKLADIHFPELITVGGGIWVQDNAALAGFSLPNCEIVASIDIKYNLMMKIFDLPRLVTVNASSIFIRSNPSLTHVNLPELKNVNDSFESAHLDSLTTFHVPHLRTIGRSFIFWHNSQDVSSHINIDFNLDKLETIADHFLICDNFNLAEIYLQDLTEVGSYLKIESNTGLISISFPSLSSVFGNLDIKQNADLDIFSLPALVFVDSLSILSNEDFDIIESLCIIGDCTQIRDITINDATCACNACVLAMIQAEPTTCRLPGDAIHDTNVQLLQSS
jgi:hypothetical protein